MSAGDHLGQQFDLPTHKIRWLGVPVSKYYGERGSSQYLGKLREDIRQNGIKEPLSVHRVDDWSSLAGEENYKGPATHIIQDGAHRLAVAKQLKLKSVPVREV